MPPVVLGLNPTDKTSQNRCPINHGNSGGALVNSLGELMGINTLSFDKSNDGETRRDQLCYSFQLATKIMDKLILTGAIRGYIGEAAHENDVTSGLFLEVTV